MRKIATIAMLSVFVLGTLPGTAWASNTKYISVSGSVSGSTLTVTFKAAGFGGTGPATATLTIDAACAATGQGQTSAAKFKNESTSETITPDGQGAASGTISLTRDCPGTQVAIYKNGVLTLTQGGKKLTAKSADGLSWSF